MSKKCVNQRQIGLTTNVCLFKKIKTIDTRYKTLMGKSGYQENSFCQLYEWFRGQKKLKKWAKNLFFSNKLVLNGSDVMRLKIPTPATFSFNILTYPHLGGVIFPSRALRSLTQLQNSQIYPPKQPIFPFTFSNG